MVRDQARRGRELHIDLAISGESAGPSMNGNRAQRPPSSMPALAAMLTS
jgi:hypothetical protein